MTTALQGKGYPMNLSELKAQIYTLLKQREMIPHTEFELQRNVIVERALKDISKFQGFAPLWAKEMLKLYAHDAE